MRTINRHKNELEIVPAEVVLTPNKKIVINDDGTETVITEYVDKIVDDSMLYTDFSIQNILRNGATDLLKPVTPVSADKLTSIDTASAALHNLKMKEDK